MAQFLAALQAEFPLLVLFFALCLGLVVGSFLNVVIYRVPIMMQRGWQEQASEILGVEPPEEKPRFDLIFPDSRCPTCGHEIEPWENIPLLSYAFLKGRCSGCGTRISLRYPLVELLTGILTIAVVAHFDLTLAALFGCLLTFALISASFIDYDHQLIPDDITLPLLWIGLIVNYFGIIADFEDAFWGAVAGYLVLWSVYQLFKLITGKEGMGFGDFKLLAMLGAWLGWQYLPLVIVLSSFTGAVVGGTLIALGRDRANPIPFGPYLAIAGFITLIWGEPITRAYLKFAAF